MNTVVLVAIPAVVIVIVTASVLVWRGRRRVPLSPRDEYRREVSRIKQATAGGAGLGLWAAGSGSDGASGGGIGSGCGSSCGGGGGGCGGGGC
ncbi:hypothetical protein A5761_01875 [Mycolicibacterium setense]|uniref:hypothetical protein n=1 Tax=Mycolicibacterium setense TaxID=431269 RepID=UPI0007EB12B3|nr:hypothetical protein [Mycolicibacterium setense]OBB13244.1 hypothetical protein A5761_01875 [Mycolicibacterium setense]